MATLLHSVSRFRHLFGFQINAQVLEDRFANRLDSLSRSAKTRLPNRRLY